MSATPETDAFMTRIRGIDGDKHWVPVNTARRLERERDEAREIAGRLAHFLERPAYSVDEAIARMEALNSYKQLATL
jgi:hypothetical protein